MRNRPVQFSAIAVFIALSASTFASPSAFNLNSAGNSRNTSIALHHVMYTDGVDNRDFMSKNVASTDPEMHIDLTPDEMEIIKKTTGHFVCGDNWGTIDIGNELNVVVVPMHAFKIAKGKKCTFQTFAGEKIPVKISKEDWAAYKKWDAKGRISAGELMRLTLERPISGVEISQLIPYKDETFKIKVSTPLIVISGLQVDWGKKNNIKRRDMREPLGYRCNPSAVDRKYEQDYGLIYTSNCDFDDGGSGSKIYSRNSSGKLLKLGMLVGSYDLNKRKNLIPNGAKSTPDGLSSRFLAINSSMVDGSSIETPVPPTANNSTKATKPNVSSNVSTASAQPSSQLSQRTDYAICLRALNSDQTAFDDRGFYKDEIEEAQRRGFDVDKCKAEIAASAAQ